MGKFSMTDSTSAISKVWDRHDTILICLILAVCTVGAYWRVGGFDFVKYDDPLYVAENPHVQAGLTREGFVWAFTTGHAGNWHPLTWLSHMLDCRIFGLNPGRHHLTNLLLHIGSTLLLFSVLKRMTGAVLRSGFVAALFALHPLHVESVAWIAERKDVLSTFFLFLTVWGYLRYAKRPGVGWYLLTVAFFALGLLAKPMLVTLPFLLLLLDYWPLERIGFGGAGGDGGSSDSRFRWRVAVGLLCEKIPLFVLSVVSSIVTFRVQEAGGSVRQMDGLFGFPIKIRIINALVSYLRYIGKMFWPSGLSVHYPHPSDKLLLWHGVVAAVLLAVVSVLVIWQLRRRKYLFVGWFWYLGMLVPVIGLIQVGAQAMADRYTYVPMVGLFIMIAWGLYDVVGKWRYRTVVVGASVPAIVAALVVCTWHQVGHWRNEMTLFQRAITVTENNEKMYLGMGLALFEQGRPEDAMQFLGEALAGKTEEKELAQNLAMMLNQQGGVDKEFTSKLMMVNPASVKGRALIRDGKVDEAIKLYRDILRDKPGDVSIRYELAVLLDKQGRIAEAITEYEETLQIAPHHPAAMARLEAAIKRQDQSRPGEVTRGQ